MGDGVNIAARLEGIADPNGICLSEDAYRQVRDRVREAFVDLRERNLKNIAHRVRVYALKTFSASSAPAPHPSALDKVGPPRLSIVVLPFANLGGDPEQEYFVDPTSEQAIDDEDRSRPRRSTPACKIAGVATSAKSRSGLGTTTSPGITKGESPKARKLWGTRQCGSVPWRREPRADN